MSVPDTAIDPARRHVLEPLRPALLQVSIAHLVIALLVAWLAFKAGGASSPAPEDYSSSQPSSDSTTQWFRPADFQAPLPAVASSQPAMEPGFSPETPPALTRSTSRFITLSRVNISPPPPASRPAGSVPVQSPAAGMDIETMRILDRLDEALYEAFMRHWVPPNPELLSYSKRTARLDVYLNPDITLAEADLVVPSGSPDLDLSVLIAADMVATSLRARQPSENLLNFPKSLPSSFQNSRYVCRIQFQIE